MGNTKQHTTLRVKKSLVKEINKLKKHPRQSCEEVIEKAISLSGGRIVKTNKGTKYVDEKGVSK